MVYFDYFFPKVVALNELSFLVNMDDEVEFAAKLFTTVCSLGRNKLLFKNIFISFIIILTISKEFNPTCAVILYI